MRIPLPPLLLAAAPEETSIRFKALPPLWALFMVVLPAAVLLVWWIYRREAPTAPSRIKRLLGLLRLGAICVVLLVLFQPYEETSVRKLVKSHLVVLLDTSASMEFIDSWSDPGHAARIREAAGLGPRDPSSVPRVDLVKGALGNPRLAVLRRLGEKFHLHVYTFDSDTSLLYSAGEAAGEGRGGGALSERIRGLEATGTFTLLGGAVSGVLEEFRLRDEPLAGVVVVTDGRQNGGTVGPLAAARKAASLRPSVPLYLVGVGDPDRPRNIHVENLRAREVVLFGDDVAFEFTVRNKGFAGAPVTVRMDSLSEEGEPREELSLSGADVVLGEEGADQVVLVKHRFRRPGSYTVRVGIPVQRGEKIENDNFLVHHLRVVDKKIKVLYVEGYPRWEYRFLQHALTRDTQTVLAHVLNLEADPEGVTQPYSRVPGWEPIDRFPARKEDLFRYDVVIFGDVDWHRLDEDKDRAREALANLKRFVEEGGGFIMVAGPYDSPRSYRNTPVADILPVVISREEESRTLQDPTVSFPLKLTAEGRRSPIMQLDPDREVSRRIWEEDGFSRQFWYYPVERAKTTARVLAVHPGRYNRNKYGPHVLVATLRYGKGRSLFVGVDELWRLRWCFGDRYYYRFYGEAIRLLATYRLLGGNRRFKFFLEKNRFFLGDPVTVSAEIYDRDFNPSVKETWPVTLRTPDGRERELRLVLDPEHPGNYRITFTVNQEGTYVLGADVGDEEEGRPVKRFRVEYATEEMRNPLIDRETMEAMARESGGRFLPLYDLGALPDAVPSRSVYVSTEVRSRDLWDRWWVLLLFTALLAAEWMLRKRYRLL